MKGTLNGKPVSISFQYGEQEHLDIDLRSHVVKTTLCQVKSRAEGEDGRLLASGFAQCSPQDNYSKRLGRKVAYVRALDYLSRGERQQIGRILVEHGFKF